MPDERSLLDIILDWLFGEPEIEENEEEIEEEEGELIDDDEYE